MRRTVSLVRAHRSFALLLLAGAVLRALAVAGYHPALLLTRDAYVYLRDAHALSVSGLRPALYPLFLKPAVVLHDLALVVAVQHMLILGVTVALYALARRLGLGPLGGALSTAPLMLDGYQIAIEHFILSEALFEVLAASACVVLLWPQRVDGRMSWARPAAVGALISLAFLTRYVGAALVPAAVLYLIMAKRPLRRRLVACAALLASFLVPIAAYSTVLQAPGGAGKIGFPLYGRVATFVDCEQIELARSERRLCPRALPRDPDHHLTIWFSESPLSEVGGTADPRVDGLLSAFAQRAISAQPTGYVASVGRDLLRYLEPTPPPLMDSKVSLWLFPRSLTDARPVHRQVERLNGSPPPGLGFHERWRVVRPLANALRVYQLVVYTWGPLLAAALLAGLLGAALGRRAPRHGPALAGPGLFFSLVILGLLLARLSLGVYGYRYMIVTLPFVGPALVMGITVLRDRYRPLGEYLAVDKHVGSSRPAAHDVGSSGR